MRNEKNRYFSLLKTKFFPLNILTNDEYVL